MTDGVGKYILVKRLIASAGINSGVGNNSNDDWIFGSADNFDPLIDDAMRRTDVSLRNLASIVAMENLMERDFIVTTLPAPLVTRSREIYQPAQIYDLNNFVAMYNESRKSYLF